MNEFVVELIIASDDEQGVMLSSLNEDEMERRKKDMELFLYVQKYNAVGLSPCCYIAFQAPSKAPKQALFVELCGHRPALEHVVTYCEKLSNAMDLEPLGAAFFHSFFPLWFSNKI